MVFVHVLQLLTKMDTKIDKLISVYFNLTTFPGFFFCFGYAFNLAYFQKQKSEVKKAMLKTALKCLGAFYASGIFFRAITTPNFLLSIKDVIKIILLFDIPGYSEFLLAFFAITLMSLLFFEQFKIVLKNYYFIVILLLFSLSCTFVVPYKYITLNQIGLLIGTTKYASFPIVQYLPWFLLGAIFCKYRVNNFKIKIFIISLLLSCGFFIYYIIYKRSPNRFPPSLIWVISPAVYIYVYYLFSKYISSIFPDIKILRNIGENILFYFLMSNIVIFLMIDKIHLNTFTSGLFTIVLIYTIYYFRMACHGTKSAQT